MIIDLTTAKMCCEELRGCLKKMEEYREQTHRVFLELYDSDTDSIREIALQVRNNLNKTDEQIEQLKTVIRGLNSIINIYQKTESKNIATLEGINVKIKDVARDIRLEGRVPADIADLFE